MIANGPSNSLVPYQTTPVTKARMQQTGIEDLLVCLIRSPQVFQEAKRCLELDYFDAEAEAHYAVLWAALLEIYPHHPRGPSKQVLIGTLEQMLADSGEETLTPQQFEDLFAPIDEEPPGLIPHAYQQPKADIDSVYGLQLLSAFIQERAVLDRLRFVFSHARGRTPLNFAQTLQAATRAQQLADSVIDDPIKPLFPTVWTPTVTFPTGIDFIDETILGQAGGEIIGVLGTFGSGKSLLVRQEAVLMAKYFKHRHLEYGDPLLHAFVLTYEQPADAVRTCAIAYAADIRRDILEKMVDPQEDLSRRGNLRDYEKARLILADRTADPPGEYERFLEAQEAIADNYHILDMSEGRSGGGWVDEISAQLNKAADRGLTPGWVGIDYVKKMAQRYCAVNGKEYDRIGRHLIAGFADDARRLVASPFNVPVWAAHQMAGRESKKSPAQALHHSDASESKDFAENLHFCFVLGNLTPDYVSRMHVTKVRRGSGAGTIHLVKIENMFGRCVSAEKDYVYSPATQKIEKRDMVNSFQGEMVTTPSPRGRGARQTKHIVSAAQASAMSNFNTVHRET